MPPRKKKPALPLPKRLQERYFASIRAGVRPGAAAEAMKLDRDSVLAQIADDENLAEALAKAEAEATEHVEEALYQAAVSGNVTAAKMWLDLRRRPGTELVTAEESFDQELAELNRIAADAGS